VLDAVQYYLPSPADRPAVKGTSPGKKKGETVEAERKPDPEEPFCGLVFKVLPAKTGDISWVRVYSGTLKQNSRVLNPAKNEKENVAQLWHIHATKKEEQVDVAGCGDIVGIVGLRHSITGDTICETREPIQLESIQFPETVMSIAIEPDSTAERKKLIDTLEMLKRQDPTLQVTASDSGQTLMRGMGELHLEVVKNRLLRDFNLKVKFHKPQVSYRETIANAVEVENECRRIINGKQLFAKVKIRMEPAPKVHGVSVLNFVEVGKVPQELVDAAVDTLKGCGEGGGRIAGFPLMKIKVSLIDAEFDPLASDEQAFRIATVEAFEEGLEKGGKVLLEPIMKLDITTPEAYLGNIVGDLQQRRATIARTDTRGDIVTIEAHAPLRELLNYSSAVRSVSQGRAGHSMEPLEYGPAPPDVVKEYAI
jgi:elongation factor G